jgi:hypothetical protein
LANPRSAKPNALAASQIALTGPSTCRSGRGRLSYDLPVTTLKLNIPAEVLTTVEDPASRDG